MHVINRMIGMAGMLHISQPRRHPLSHARDVESANSPSVRDRPDLSMETSLSSSSAMLSGPPAFSNSPENRYTICSGPPACAAIYHQYVRYICDGIHMLAFLNAQH